MSGGVKQFGELFQLVIKKYESDQSKPEPRNSRERSTKALTAIFDLLFKFIQAHHKIGVLFVWMCKPFQ